MRKRRTSSDNPRSIQRGRGLCDSNRATAINMEPPHAKEVEKTANRYLSPKRLVSPPSLSSFKACPYTNSKTNDLSLLKPGLDSSVCACSLYRVAVLNRLSFPDATWADTEPAIWAAAENCIGIVSASLPTMRPLYNLIVRGHHCSSHERQCTRCCEQPSISSGAGAGHRRRRRHHSRRRSFFNRKWPAPSSADDDDDDEASRNARKARSDIESANTLYDGPVEMVLYAKGPTRQQHLDHIVMVTTTVEISG